MCSVCIFERLFKCVFVLFLCMFLCSGVYASSQDIVSSNLGPVDPPGPAWKPVNDGVIVDNVQEYFTQNITNIEFVNLKKGDCVCIYINGKYISIEILEIKNKTVIFRHDLLGKCEISYEEFNKVYIKKKETSTVRASKPENRLKNINSSTNNNTESRALISVWVNGPFWSTWRWAYGPNWGWLLEKGETKSLCIIKLVGMKCMVGLNLITGMQNRYGGLALYHGTM